MSGFNEFIPSELDILANKPVLLSINDSSVLEYTPLNSLDNAKSIEFLSLAYNDRYKDLSWAFLKLRVQILKNDLTLFKDDGTLDKIQPHLATNALHSIFKSAYVSLGSTNVRSVESNYAFKEWLEATLNFDIESASSRLSSQHYVPNADGVALTKLTKDSKIVELYGKINLMNLSKLLIPGISVSFKFNLSEPDFYMVEDTTKTLTKSIIKIHSARLYLRHVSTSAEILLTHEKLLSSGRPAVYEYKRGDVVTQNVARGVSNLNIQNFYNGVKPSLIAFGMLSNDVYSGKRTSNPFQFTPQKLTSFNFVVNGSSKPINPYTFINNEKESSYSHIFSSIYESLGYHANDRTTLITRYDFILI